MLKKQRMKTLTALAVSAAMAVLTVSPVMGEEMAPEISGGIALPETAEIFEAGDGFVPEDLRLNSDDASGMHYYDEPLYIKSDGIYRYDGKTKLEEHPGISYNGETHTLSLNNFCLGLGYFDDTIDFEFRDEAGKSGYYKGGDIQFLTEKSGTEYPDITIHLEGHNVIGSYSNFSRVYGEGSEIGGNARTVSFDGTGDLTLLNGFVDFTSEYKHTGSHLDDPSAPIYSSLPIYKIRWNSEYGVANKLGNNLSGIVRDNNYIESIPGDGSSRTLKADFVQIGGEKPDFPVDYQYTVVSENLGVIGGHSVSVCYTDNIPYSGKKIQLSDRYEIYDVSENGLIVKQPVYRTSEGKELYSTSMKLEEKTNVMDMEVYVDGKLIPAPLVSVKYKNNVNAGTVNNGKTVSPCFCFQIKDKCTIKPTDKKGNFFNEGESRLKDQKIKLSSGLDKNFNKALKEYFRNKENWIRFTIVPQDIRTAAPYRYNDRGDKIYHQFRVLNNDSFRMHNEELRKYCKINGNTVKAVTLFDRFGKKLKWDKKYTDGKEDPKKNFHVTLSDNYIVYTGQGNYKGSVMIRKSYATGK
ncbi:MAG: hypothetical protein K6A90_04680 [Lachnospiraceae bacterium]|nr:hypothetical protein [Lachnospiraceae bacterium]